MDRDGLVVCLGVYRCFGSAELGFCQGVGLRGCAAEPSTGVVESGDAQLPAWGLVNADGDAAVLYCIAMRGKTVCWRRCRVAAAQAAATSDATESKLQLRMPSSGLRRRVRRVRVSGSKLLDSLTGVPCAQAAVVMLALPAASTLDRCLFVHLLDPLGFLCITLVG